MVLPSHAFYYLHLLPLLAVHIYAVFVSARDTLTLGQYISDTNGQNLTSAGETFQLGFFTPKGNNNDARYIGIWYMKDPDTVVWVANRDHPLRDKTGVLVIDEDGDLKVMGGFKGESGYKAQSDGRIYFSTQVEIRPSSRTVKLLDTGNLILTDDQVRWQSFNNPTNTFLPGMKMSENLNLTSWKDSIDPASGDYTFQQDPEVNNRYVIYKTRTTLYWRSGGASRSFIPNQIFDAALMGFILSNMDQLRNVSLSQRLVSLVRDFNNTRLVMNYKGEIQYYIWNVSSERWVLYGFEPKDECSVHNICGKSGKCNTSGGLSCTCLPGFEPNLAEDWKSGDYSNGCTRLSGKCSKKEGFLNLKVTKVGNPELPFYDAESEEICADICRRNCKCVAYAHVDYRINDTGIGKRKSRLAPDQRERNRRGCWFWTSDLIDLQQGYGDGVHNLSVKYWVSDTGGASPQQPAPSQDSQHKQTSLLSPSRVIILTVAIIVVALFCIISYIICRRRASKRKESIPDNPVRQLYNRERQAVEWIGQDQLSENDKNVIDVPFFDLEIILAATNNFSDANKLGQGGFGPVYKGEFPGGEVMAVKRLSSHSGQGLQEFKNEVVLIAKLQHRNLVRILGYCVEGEEKILIYEYMRNKSLDAFIFDKTLGTSLDWARRFDIILGITRGLMYLHHDSRLRIIHRDLKTSNILLDEEMNPKISDFGLAKIVVGKETRANTNRVVGSYGYMSPEYALDGEFSIKSDVFSFGVVVLEIISGKKNTGFYQSKIALNLLGYAWGFWKEDNALALVDSAVAESCNRSEVLKCINVGLLCVQDDPSDRPTMSNVIFMLGGETETLPHPKQPAFIERKRLSSTPSSSSSKLESQSSNNVTFSAQEGR